MATSLRCLCFVLTVGMVAMRPSTTIRTESPDSVWWGTKQSEWIQNSARKKLIEGKFAAAEEIFEQGVREASQRHDPIATARYLSGVAGARMAHFDYREALSAYLRARKLARTSGDLLDFGAIELNLSSLYRQVWDLDSSLRAAEEAVEAVQRIPHPYYLPQLYLQLGQIHADTGDRDAAPFFEKGIQSAQDSHNMALEASGWDLLGQLRISRGDLDGAEHAYLQSFLLRRLGLPRDLGLSYLRLGGLRLAQGEAAASAEDRRALLKEAEFLTRLALNEQTRGHVVLPTYILRHRLGRIRLAQGRIPEALEDLGGAVELAGEWRAGIPPALSSLNGTSAKIEERISADFIDAAAAYGIRTGNRSWIEKSFQAAEVSRSASLQDSRALAEIWRRKLPTEFWETLSNLRAEDARLMRIEAGKSPRSDRLRLKLTEMEAEAGLGFPLNSFENFRSRSSLIHFRRGLRDSEVLLSFALGEKESFLWAVTRTTFTVYRVAPRERIRKAVEEFREAVETGRPDTDMLGEQLYGMLFGQLSSKEASKPEWLLSVEDALLELPFAALTPERTASGKPVYLAERHSVRVIPGALVSRTVPAATVGKQGGEAMERFLGVADPVYNSADPRWSSVGPATHPAGLLPFWFPAPAAVVSGQLSRLPGSGREVESSANVWTSLSGRDSIVLEGTTATRTKFLNSLVPTPAVIHLATHVLTPPQNREQALIAFGLGANGQPEMLATSDIAMLKVPQALIVMTGCATADGDAREGASLEGLTRAWTIAGARAVLATEWPVTDSTGALLIRFYRHLRNSPPAEALRRSQIEMIRSGTAFAAPAVWASFQVFGGGFDG